jgi:sugar phosphate isomerase/epimerase
MPMKLGLCTGTYSDLELKEVCELAVEYGYETLEIETFERDNKHLDIHTILECGNIKKLKDIVKSYGLEISSLGNHPETQLVMGPYGQDTDDIYNGSKEEKIAFGTKAAIKAAQVANAMEIPVVVGFVGCENFGRVCQWPDAGAWSREEEIFAKRWGKILDKYEEYGVKFAHEPHPNQMVYDIETALHSVELLDGRKSWGFNYDPANMLMYGIDVELFIDLLGDRIYSVHAKDAQIVKQNVNRSGLNPYGNYRRIDRGFRFRIPGWGSIRWRDVVTELAMVGYFGALHFEHEDITMSRIDGMKKTADYLKPLLIDSPVEGRSDLNFRF